MRVPVETSEEVQQAFREVWAAIDKIPVDIESNPHEINLHGSRVTNAGLAIQPRDYVTKLELDDAIGSLEIPESVSAQISSTPDFAGFSTGSIVHINPAETGAEDNTNLYWDVANLRLGVGTNSPRTRAELVGTTGGSHSDDIQLTLNAATGGSAGIDFTESLTLRGRINIGATVVGIFNETLLTTEGLFLTHGGGGNVGIGTAAPARKLHVKLQPPGAYPLRLESDPTAVAVGMELAQGVVNRGFIDATANRVGITNATGGGFLWLDNASDNLGINVAPDASALLELSSGSKGFLMPRMTTVERLAIASPAIGLEVYDTDLNSPFFYDGTWQSMAGISGQWQDGIFGPKLVTFTDLVTIGNTAAEGGLNKLHVEGSVSIGSGYGDTAAPASGAIINGDVGIGTNIPRGDAKVTVVTSSIDAGLALIGTTPAIRFYNATQTLLGAVGIDATNIWLQSQAGVKISVSHGTGAISLADTTTISDGTASYPLIVAGSGAVGGITFRTTSTTRGFVDGTSSRMAITNSAGTSYLWVDQSANRVGVSVANPTESLHVAGKIRIGTQATLTTDAVRADRLINTDISLTGGGDLTANRTIALNTANANTWTAVQRFDAQPRVESGSNPSITFTTGGTQRGVVAATSTVMQMSNGGGGAFVQVNSSNQVVLNSTSIGSSKTVSVGANDSGGSGFKVLRVPN